LDIGLSLIHCHPEPIEAMVLIRQILWTGLHCYYWSFVASQYVHRSYRLLSKTQANFSGLNYSLKN